MLLLFWRDQGPQNIVGATTVAQVITVGEPVAVTLKVGEGLDV